MKLHWGGENLTKLGVEAADSSPSTGSRLKGQETSVGVELLDRLALYFNVEPWQLLVSDFSAERPPTLTTVANAPFSPELVERLAMLQPSEIHKLENGLRGQLEMELLPRVESFQTTTEAQTSARKSSVGSGLNRERRGRTGHRKTA